MKKYKYLYDGKVYSFSDLQKNSMGMGETIEQLIKKYTELSIVVPNYNRLKQELDKKSAIIDVKNKTYTYGIKSIIYYAVFSKEKEFIETTDFNPHSRYLEDALFTTFTNRHFLKIINSNWSVDDNNKLFRKEESSCKKDIEKYLKKYVSNLFVEKVNWVKKRAIDKPEIQLEDFDSPQDYYKFIDAQVEAYKTMNDYVVSLPEQTKDTKEIIEKHKKAVEESSVFILALQNIKSLLMSLITNGQEPFELIDVIEKFKIEETDNVKEKLFLLTEEIKNQMKG